MYSHGVSMWLSWVLFAAFQLISKRYMKRYYNLSMALHAFFGSLILLLTLYGGITAISAVRKYEMGFTAHALFGFFTFFYSLIVGGIGVLAMMYGYYAKPIPWSTKKETHLLLGSVHKHLARFLVFAGFITTTLGLARYQRLFSE